MKAQIGLLVAALAVGGGVAYKELHKPAPSKTVPTVNAPVATDRPSATPTTPTTATTPPTSKKSVAPTQSKKSKVTRPKLPTGGGNRNEAGEENDD